jgi:hypothetical protein
MPFSFSEEPFDLNNYENEEIHDDEVKQEPMVGDKVLEIGEFEVQLNTYFVVGGHVDDSFHSPQGNCTCCPNA